MFLPVFVCLSVCLLARLLKNACMDLNEMLRVSTDVGTWTNRLTFEPDPDYSPDAGTGLRHFTSGKSHVYVLARPAAEATRGFKVVLFTQPSKHFCRRYMRSTV